MPIAVDDRDVGVIDGLVPEVTVVAAVPADHQLCRPGRHVVGDLDVELLLAIERVAARVLAQRQLLVMMGRRLWDAVDLGVVLQGEEHIPGQALFHEGNRLAVARVGPTRPIGFSHLEAGVAAHDCREACRAVLGRKIPDHVLPVVVRTGCGGIGAEHGPGVASPLQGSPVCQHLLREREGNRVCRPAPCPPIEGRRRPTRWLRKWSCTRERRLPPRQQSDFLL